MEIKRKKPIGMELVKKGIITEEDIDKALDYQKKYPNVKIGEAIHKLKICDENELITAIGEILGVQGILISDRAVKIKPTDYLSLETMKKNKCIPFDIESGRIKVCFANTANNRLDPIRLQLLSKGLVMEAYVSFEDEVDLLISSMENEATEKVEDLQKTSESGTITELVDSIIRNGMTQRASDIHIEPTLNDVRVRYRIDGELFTATRIAKEKQTQIIGRLKAISNMHQEKQEAQDGRILLYDDYNIRVSSQPNVYGEKFVLRLLKKEASIRNIFDLGYPGTEEDLKKSFNKKNSVTVVAAPTGEGKTTTLYSIIDYLNSPEINITTIEDPVEIRIDGLNQIEIGNKSTFSGSLRTVLRQDPDIILVGEIRDTETAEIAIQAGQTGHYVLSTIHTIDAIEVINRLRKMNISDYDISSTLATTVSQRLVRRICPKCRKEREFTEQEKEIISKLAKKYEINVDLDNSKTYEAVGCEYCNHTGYYGRTGIFEVLDITDEIKELIVKGGSTIEIRKKAMEQGYKPLIVDGINKIMQGYTTLDELNKKLIIY